MDKEIYKAAKKKVKKKKEFYMHFGMYLVGVLMFFIINYMTDQRHWWFIYPTLGWGMGIIGHYIDVFGFPGVHFSDDWEERELLKEARKLQREKELIDDPDDLLPDDELELKEFKKLRKEWDDQDFV